MLLKRRREMPKILKNGKVIIFDTAKIIGEENIEFGDYIIIDDFVFIYAKKKIKFGNYIHIAVGSSIIGSEMVVMEDFSGLSAGVRVYTSSDDFSAYGFGNPSISEKFRNVKHAPVIIKRFAIIGANSVILPGVTIGEGAAVGAGSVVTKDLEPWGIYIGNRKVGERDRNGILKNYEEFLNTPEEDRIGNLFKIFRKGACNESV
jgi:galactoside O-acetyltransferase